jgi:hypothetical protein
MADRHPAWDRIETDAHIETGALPIYPPDQHSIELSKAISLKRIADLLAEGLADLGGGHDRGGFIGRIDAMLADRFHDLAHDLSKD